MDQRTNKLPRPPAALFGLYGTAAYLRSRPTKRYEFIAFDQELGLPQQRWLLRAAAGRPIILRTNDLESQWLATRTGLGIAALPTFLAARSPELVLAKCRSRPIIREVWLVVHSDLKNAPPIRAVIEFLAEATSELRPAVAGSP